MQHNQAVIGVVPALLFLKQVFYIWRMNGIAKKCSGSELARLLGITPRRVAQLVDEGTFKIEKKDTYDAATSIQAYIAMRENVLAEQYGKGEFGRARASLYTQRARKMELEAQKLEGSLVLRSETASSWLTWFRLFKQQFQALPTRIAPQMVNLKTPMAAQSVMSNAVNELLQEFADMTFYSDPEKDAA
jgi:hypothetical protein